MRLPRTRPLLSPHLRQQSPFRHPCKKLLDGIERHWTIDRRQRVADLACGSRAVGQVQRFVGVVAAFAARAFEIEEGEFGDAVVAEVVFEVVVAEGVEEPRGVGLRL